MSDTANIERFPKWRQAAADFLAEFKYGDLVDHEWLAIHFGMPSVDEERSLTAAEFRERQFNWLASIEGFKTELLEEHQVYLESVYGKGYRWTSPQEQTTAAMRTFAREAQRLFRQTAKRLRHVRVAELNDGQRRENIDSLNKLGMLRTMQRKELR